MSRDITAWRRQRAALPVTFGGKFNIFSASSCVHLPAAYGQGGVRAQRAGAGLNPHASSAASRLGNSVQPTFTPSGVRMRRQQSTAQRLPSLSQYMPSASRVAR